MSNSTTFNAIRAGLGASRRMDINDRYVFSKFYGPLRYTLREVGAPDGIALVSDAAINALSTADGQKFEVRLEQATDVGVFAVTHARGLSLALDVTDNEGCSVDLGYGAASAETARSMGAFTIGTDADFFLRMIVEIGDVSDLDQVAVGFAVGGHPVDGLINTYSDMAFLNVDNGDIKLETRLNSAGDAAVDSTQNVVDWAAAGNEVELEVRVSANGTVKFLIDGAAPTVDVTGFQFDDGDVVNAVFTCLADAGGTPALAFGRCGPPLRSGRSAPDHPSR